MADVITVAQAKGHLRVTQSSEDSTIQIYVSAATAYIRNRLNSRIPGEDQATPNIPQDIKAAALILVGEMYEKRSIIIESRTTISPMVDNLLSPYRKRMGI
jgi:hypothetical protein